MSRKPDGKAEVGSPGIDGRDFVISAQQAKKKYGRFNLAIIGDTGVGKSSLVNAVFGRDLAKVGKGLPVTSGVHYYHDDSLGVWDFEGFEIGDRSAADSLREHLRTVSQRPQEEQISVVWYCVLSTQDRVPRAAIDMVRQLDAAGLPVIMVLTKVDWERNPVTGKRKPPKDVQEFLSWIEDPFEETPDGRNRPVDIPIQRVIPVSTRNRNGKDTGYGLGELIEETSQLLPEGKRNAFRIAQQINLPWKHEMARPVIATAVASAAAAAAIPLPVADAVTLAPIQMTMMGRIATIYDLELKTMLSAESLANLCAQIAGKALAGSLIKLIPGAGSVVNAAVASALTASAGEGWAQLCERIYTGKIDVTQLNDDFKKFIPSFLDVIKTMAEQKVAK